MYSYDDIKRRIQTGEYQSLGLEAIGFYHEADFLFAFDPDLPAMIASLAASGAIEPLSRAQIQCLIGLFLAVVARMAKPSSYPIGSLPDVPEAFRKGLAGLDLESL